MIHLVTFSRPSGTLGHQYHRMFLVSVDPAAIGLPHHCGAYLLFEEMAHYRLSILENVVTYKSTLHDTR